METKVLVSEMSLATELLAKKKQAAHGLHNKAVPKPAVKSPIKAPVSISVAKQENGRKLAKSILDGKNYGDTNVHCLLTPERKAIICEFIRNGNYKGVAVRAAGISDSTYSLWMHNAKLAEEAGATVENNIYMDFRAAVRKAEADGQVELVETVRKAAAQTRDRWQPAAWLLERRYPDQFSKNEKRRIEVSGPDGEPIKVQGELIIDDHLIEESLKVLVDAGALKAIPETVLLDGGDDNV